MQRLRATLLTSITTLLLLLCCLPAPAAVTVILVRHAEKADSTTDPPLSAAGLQRALALATVLSDARITTIYVTEYQRTKATAQPLATQLHLTPEVIAADNTSKLLAAIEQHTSGVILVVGHSNTLPSIISLLGGPSVAIADNQYDNLFLLTLSPKLDSFTHLHYGAASSASSTSSQMQPMMNQGDSIMKITFVRSGGFAGMATNVEGTVTFDATGAHITSTKGSFHRDIPLSEATLLRSAIQAALGSTANPDPPSQVRDGYQYDITVTTDDGKTHSITFGDGSLRIPAALKQWIKDEVAKIWAAQ
jgi:broad specificity phosphatase PhoE